jgi:ParB-like chromosome segregation protein Spo0J
MGELHTAVERRRVDALIPYANNPKEHPDEQVKKIASSIKNYGWDQPIVVDGEGEIIKGHGRLQAAELLGLDEVPVIERDDLTDAEARASRIADNKTAESAWLDDELSAELDTISEEFDATALGFDGDELDDMLGDLDVPDFEPATTEEQGDLDGRTEIECPECGHEFHR